MPTDPELEEKTPPKEVSAKEEKEQVEAEQREGSESSDDDEPQTIVDIREKRITHWKESPFAVGNVNIQWTDDRPSCCCGSSKTNNTSFQRDSHVCCSAWFCGCLGAGRVGNMAVLLQTTEEYDHLMPNNNEAETGDAEPSTTITNRRTRPRLLWVMGPYWPVNLCVTYPLILGISVLTAWKQVRYANMTIIITWSIATFSLIFSLAMVACGNPGILYRYASQPPDSEDWRWNDQSRTFRPPKARFDPECQVVVEGFDHTCPWTGTAIGSRNMFWFKTFLFSLLICICYDVCLHIFGSSF